MKHKGLYIAFLLMLVSLTTFAQEYPAQTDSLRLEKYKAEIGIDMSVPNFDTKTIDAKVIGERLANLLIFLHETYAQPTYERRLTTIISEQNEKLSLVPLHIKNLKLIKISKHSDVLTIKYNAQLEKNWAKIKKSDHTFEFIDGISNDSIWNTSVSKLTS